MGMLPAGAVDNTEANGGMALGTPLTKGECYKVYALLEGFKQSQFIFRIPM